MLFATSIPGTVKDLAQTPAVRQWVEINKLGKDFHTNINNEQAVSHFLDIKKSINSKKCK